MNKLFATIGIMAITVSSVLGSPPTPGNSVQCGTPSQSGNSADCQPCGSTNDIQNLFTPQTSPTCLVSQCYNISIDVINGFVCSSCSKYEAFYPFGSGKVNFDPTTQTCVSSCPAGYSPDMYLNCQPSGGSSVNCGTPGSGGNPGNCNLCGINSTVQALFKYVSASDCKVIDCTLDPAANLNGLMCKSCSGQAGAHSAYTGQFLQGNTCASSCSQGYAPDANNICQNVSGTSVACGTASTGSNPSTNCNGCGANATIQALFQPTTTPTCKVINCALDPSTNLNGWMCKSCYGASGAHSAYANGQYFQGGACVSSCSGGQVSDATNTCQKVSGADVNCGTASNAGGNSSNCNGCGANNTIQGLFTPSGTPNCKVTDCSANPTNLNGWMCKSCYGASGAHSAYANGQYFQGGACVSSCSGGQVSDATNTCQAVSGADVNCGTASNAGGNSSNCNGCGANNTIQGLFTPSGTPNCKVTDCSANPTNLNGWMCKSCSGATNAHSAYSAGKLFSGTTCVASCPSGQTADANNICQADTNSTSSAKFLAQALTMLFLCLFF